jgi:hypothetical protein
MIKITLVFYQHPEADHELQQWETTQKVHKKDHGKGRIVYTMLGKDEMLHCFDINNFKIEEVLAVFKYSDTGIEITSYIYNKTLIFGKITYMNLVKIQQILLKLDV